MSSFKPLGEGISSRDPRFEDRAIANTQVEGAKDCQDRAVEAYLPKSCERVCTNSTRKWCRAWEIFAMIGHRQVGIISHSAIPCSCVAAMNSCTVETIVGVMSWGRLIATSPKVNEDNDESAHTTFLSSIVPTKCKQNICCWVLIELLCLCNSDFSQLGSADLKHALAERIYWGCEKNKTNEICIRVQACLLQWPTCFLRLGPGAAVGIFNLVNARNREQIDSQ